MSIIYLLALAAVAVALLAATVSAVASVSRRAEWEQPRDRPQLQIVTTGDRRQAALPFVGKDRRLDDPADAAVADEAVAA